MKKIVLFLLFSLSCITLLNAQTNMSTTPAASMLFKNMKTKLSVAEKNEIARLSKLLLSKDKKRFMIEEDADPNYRVSAYPVDMNKDGKEEIFILENSGYFGQAGAQVRLYIKDASGKYQVVLDDTGIPGILATMAGGYPELQIGGPGFEQPIYRFNGKMYTFYKKIKDGSIKKIMDVEETSKLYQGTVK